MKNKLIYIIGSTMVAGSLMLSGTALAAGNARFKDMTAAPAIFGSVTEVSDSRITVKGRSGTKGLVTTYTVDTSGATITEGIGLGAEVLPSAHIEVGDRVAVLNW